MSGLQQRRNARWQRRYKRRLTGAYVRMLRDLQPDFFLMENVPGLYRTRKHRAYLISQLSRLEKDGTYAIDWSVLNALELGVPQNRERLFVVGFRSHLASAAVAHRVEPRHRGWFPWPVHARYADARLLQWPTVAPFGCTPKRPKHIPLELTVFLPCGVTAIPKSFPTERSTSIHTLANFGRETKAMSRPSHLSDCTAIGSARQYGTAIRKTPSSVEAATAVRSRGAAYPVGAGRVRPTSGPATIRQVQDDLQWRSVRDGARDRQGNSGVSHEGKRRSS